MANILEFLSKDGHVTPEKARKSRQMQFRDKTAYVWGLRYRGSQIPGSPTLCHPGVTVFYNMCKCGSFLSYVCDVKVVFSRFYRWYSAVWLLLWYKSSICETVWPLPWYKGLWHRRTERMCNLVEAGLVRRRAVSTWSIDFLSLGQTLRNTELHDCTNALLHAG